MIDRTNPTYIFKVTINPNSNVGVWHEFKIEKEDLPDEGEFLELMKGMYKQLQEVK